RLRDLIVLDAVPEAGGNGLLDCPPDRLDLMSSQAQALGSATLSRMADTVHDGLTEMRGTTAPRLLLELLCARMLLPATDSSSSAVLQRLERIERRLSIAGEHAGRGDDVPPVREPETYAVPPAPERPAPERPAGPRREYVRPSQARTTEPRTAEAAPPAPAPAAPAAPAPAAAAPAAPAATAQAPAVEDDWPETVQPGSGLPTRPAAAAPATSDRPAAHVASGEPDVPLPPEPTDDEDWPHPARPADAAAAAARVQSPTPAQPAAPPRAAAESSPAPRGGEPLPTVSANAQPASGAGDLTTADVRRVWPELLAVVKRHKRTTEALLKNAQVHELKNGVLTLSTSSPALSRRIGDNLNKDVLREALSELLGVRWKVEAVVEGAGRGPAEKVSPEVAREAARAAEAAEARELIAERAAEQAAGITAEEAPVVDPEEAALSLLRAHLGARPIDS
ncbi:MAG: DNA polymerase III subunit gamma/tau, partial [Kineosporiaceae bacterium]